MAKIKVRKGMSSVALDKKEFTKRFLARFYDPDYEPLMPELDKIVDAAWLAYEATTKVHARGKQVPIQNSIFPSNGWKRAVKVRPPAISARA